MKMCSEMRYGLKAMGAGFMIVTGLLLCLVSVSGCEREQKLAQQTESLDKMAEAYWTVRFIHKDYRAAYEMELEKGTLPFEQYVERVRNAGEIRYKSIKTDRVKIEDGKGVVDLTMTCRLPNAPADMGLPVKGDVWRLESNQWKHVLAKQESKTPLPMPSLGR